MVEKFPVLFKNITTIKDTEINIQLKPDHYLMKQKARPTPLPLQEEDRTKELTISKIDLDYAYSQMKLSKGANRQCVFALSGGKFS